MGFRRVRSQESVFRAYDFKFWGFRFRVSSFEFRVSSFEFRVLSFELRVTGTRGVGLFRRVLPDLVDRHAVFVSHFVELVDAHAPAFTHVDQISRALEGQ